MRVPGARADKSVYLGDIRGGEFVAFVIKVSYDAGQAPN